MQKDENFSGATLYMLTKDGKFSGVLIRRSGHPDLKLDKSGLVELSEHLAATGQRLSNATLENGKIKPTSSGSIVYIPVDTPPPPPKPAQAQPERRTPQMADNKIKVTVKMHMSGGEVIEGVHFTECRNPKDILTELGAMTMGSTPIMSLRRKEKPDSIVGLYVLTRYVTAFEIY